MKNLTRLGLLALAGLNLALAPKVMAAPILNVSEGVNDLITLYPDDHDKNLFYIAPSVFLVSREADGLPIFSYVEFRECVLCRTRALVQTTMTSALKNEEALKKAMEVLRARNPQARFAPLPVQSATVSMADSLGKMIIQNDCNHPGGQIGSEQACTFVLNARGRNAFRSLLKEALTITLNYKYSVAGVRVGADGKFTNSEIEHVVAGRIGGPLLKNYPQLFRDRHGNVITEDSDALMELD
jgi:hypothetical protein